MFCNLIKLIGGSDCNRSACDVRLSCGQNGCSKVALRLPEDRADASFGARRGLILELVVDLGSLFYWNTKVGVASMAISGPGSRVSRE